MLSQNTIDAVKALPIEQVLRRYVELKAAGSSLKACCPLHGEKTPSFNVNKVSGRWKCFGCQKGGDAIAFVQEKFNLPFYEAIKTIASDNNVLIEESFDESISPERRKELRQRNDTAYLLLDKSDRRYRGHLQSDDPDAKKVLRYLLHDRKLGLSTIHKWGLGYAPHNFQFLQGDTIPKNDRAVAVEIGLLREKDGKYTDAQINRLTIPIRNVQGAIIGFGSRDVSGAAPSPNQGSFVPAKYLNLGNSFIYRKENVLFGLHNAAPYIRKHGYVILVEGYMSVIRMDQFGMSHAVATCGTALTEGQAKELKRYTDKIVLMRDADDAGYRSIVQNIPTLLNAGFKVQVFLLTLPQADPDPRMKASDYDPEYKDRKLDPDDACDELVFHRKTIEKNSVDGTMFYIDHLARTADSVTTKSEEIAKFIGRIDNPITRELYTTRALDAYTFIPKKSFLNLISLTVKNSGNKGEEREDETSSVWYRADKSIWIKAKNGWDVVASNFHIYIMYVAEDDRENITWVLRLELESGENVYLEVEHDDFTSASRLAKIIASKQLALKITGAHLAELHEFLFTRTSYKRAIKITRFGYHEQSDSFIYSNGALIPCEPGEDGKAYKIAEPDDFGMVHTDKYYLSLPKVPKNIRQPFTITDHAITFDEWFTVFTRTHLIRHTFGAACHTIFSLFRDIGLRHKSFSPIFFLKGSAGTGKSSIIRSATCIYGFTPKEINLKGKNSEPGIIRTMSATSNGLIWMDEFINLHPFEGILQAAYDNAGQVKASGSSGLELDNVELKSALALTSNYLPENPIFFSRCVYDAVMDQTKTPDQTRAFNEMRQLEEKGLAQISIELMQHRALIEEHYGAFYDQLYKGFKQHQLLAGLTVPERLFGNMAQIMTAAFILCRADKIHMTEELGREGVYDEFVNRGAEYIYRQYRVQTEKTALHEFFEILQMMYDKSEIFELVHFKLEDGVNVAFRFGALYTLFKARYRNVNFREAPDRETIKDELCKLTNVDHDKLFTQIRFLQDITDTGNSRTVPTKDCFRCSYQLLVDTFGIDFKSRKMAGTLGSWAQADQRINRN
ncbi:MAG: toprim domain-containing protein [Bacteroidetes bacterium]|nr:toprim domain-containing protein [Bacteroidota bacterium]